MKQSCDVIKDLLILYEDDACSEDSIQLIEEHLKDCPACSEYLKKLQHTEGVISGEIKEECSPDDKVMKRSMKKIRRRWIASLVAVFMLIPLLGAGFMGYHEAHGEGVAFSNLDDIYRCIRYLKYIEDGKFEEAAELVDFEYALVESVKDMTLEEYQAYMKERFICKLQEYNDLGLYIDNIGYKFSYRVNGDRWTICISFDEHYPDGSKQKLNVDMNGETLSVGAYSYPHTEKVNMDTYIDEILYLYSEDDVLDYQEMEVSFVLKEGEKAIISGISDAEARYNLSDTGLFNISYGTGTELINEPYKQESITTSVPGTYSICGVTEQGERAYLTAEDLEIQIINYD